MLPSQKSQVLSLEAFGLRLTIKSMGLLTIQKYHSNLKSQVSCFQLQSNSRVSVVHPYICTFVTLVYASKSSVKIKSQIQASKSSIIKSILTPHPSPPHSLFHPFVILIQRVRKQAFFQAFLLQDI